MLRPQIDPAVAYLSFLAAASDERLARVAERRAFVEMKQSFMRSAGLVRGAMGPMLRRQARLATSCEDLWRLRDALYEHLPEAAAPERHELRRLADARNQSLPR